MKRLTWESWEKLFRTKYGFWWHLWQRIMGRKWYFAVDPGKPGGDMTGYVLGYVDRQGTIHIVKAGAEEVGEKKALDPEEVFTLYAAHRPKAD